MKRIVILGCENSHAQTFLNILKNDPAYADISVVGVYSVEPEPARALHESFSVPVMENYDAAVGQADGVIVTARDGRNHYKYAAPYLRDGVPMFIDKPVASDEEDAIRLASEAKARGVRLTGGSCCRFAAFVQTLKEEARTQSGGPTVGGLVRAPVSLTNAYGGYWFYAQHLVDMVTEIYGRFPSAVRAAREGAKITVLFRYEGFDVTGLYVDGSYRYYAARYAADGENAGLCAIDDSCFDAEFAEFADLLDGAPMKDTYESFIAPVFIMNAVQTALESGEEETVWYAEI